MNSHYIQLDIADEHIRDILARLNNTQRELDRCISDLRDMGKLVVRKRIRTEHTPYSMDIQLPANGIEGLMQKIDALKEEIRSCYKELEAIGFLETAPDMKGAVIR